MLLEDLLEQEKREQARHTVSSQIETSMPNQSQQSILNDMVRQFNRTVYEDKFSTNFFFKDYEKLRAEVLTSANQGISQNVSQMQSLPQQLQQQHQFAPRGVVNKQWRAQTPIVSTHASTSSSDLVRSVPVFQANLQGISIVD